MNRLLSKWLKKPIQIADERLPLRLAHKKVYGREVFFVINDSAVEISTNVFFRTRKKLEKWDPATGKVCSVTRETEVILKPYHVKIYRTH